MPDFYRNYNPAAAKTNATNGFYQSRPYNLAASVVHYPAYTNLTSDIAINSTTVSPALRLLGSTPAATPWVPDVGDKSLAEAGTGSSPTYGVAGTYGTGVTSAYNNKFYTAHASAQYNPGTKDIVWEIVFKYAQTQNSLFLLYLADVTAPVYHMYFQFGATATPGIVFYLKDGVTPSWFGTVGLVSGTTYLMHVFVNRDLATANGGLMYLNGAYAGGGDLSARSAMNLANGSNARGYFMGYNSSAYTCDCTLYYAAAYYGAAWLSDVDATHRSHADAFAAARYTLLLG